MPRPSPILCLPAALMLAATAPAADPPAGETQLPVIINYPSAALHPSGQKADGKLPVILGQRATNPAPARFAVAYPALSNADLMSPVAYNVYGGSSFFGLDSGIGYSFYSPYGAGLGWYGGVGCGGCAYTPCTPVAPWGLDPRPPRFELLDTGVRANIGHLVSLPSVAAPVYGSVLGVYYH